MSEITLFLGELWHTPAAPGFGDAAPPEFKVFSKGALAVDADGEIVDAGDAQPVKARHAGATVVDHGDAVIMPGFVDAHVHFPQLDIIGSHGEQLLGWLDTYTYPEEAKFADRAYAAAQAERFTRELVANGTTLAACYSSSHPAATEALFKATEALGTRAIIGKVSMDRGAPEPLLQEAAADVAAQAELIASWHGKDDRLFYALTPRFALSCSETLLGGLGDLRSRHPTLYVQSHHAETPDEIAEVKKLFPRDPNYLAVYDRFGLLGDRTILGHAIHVGDDELALYQRTKTRIAHCPTSNLFLGSGLCPLARYAAAGVPLALATDVGGGTSLSMLKTMAAAYEVQRLRGDDVSPAYLFHLATQGGADALHLGHQIGSFAPGKAADFQVLDWRRSRLLKRRFETSRTAIDRLFALMFLGDDRLVKSVVVAGKEVYKT